MSNADLIARLEALTGPDREVDAEIWLATTPGATRRSVTVRSTTNLWRSYGIDETRDGQRRLVTVPAYSASLDAAIALTERLLPGWTWGAHPNRGLRRAYVVETSPLRPMPVIAVHATPAIALLIATLKAHDNLKEADHG